MAGRWSSGVAELRFAAVTSDARGEGAAALVAQAEALEEAGSLREALGKWREVVAHEASAVALVQRGRLAAELNERDEAERSFLDSIAMAPKWTLPYEALAILYRDVGDLGKAEEYLRLSLGLERKARTLTFLGDVLERLARHPEAENTLREAVATDPTYAEAYVLLGRVMREDPKAAIQRYRQAVDLDPDYVLAHRELGWALRRLDQLDEAEEHIRRAIELDNKEMWSYAYLGNILWRKGDFDGAERAFQQAIAVGPNDSTGYWCLADLLSDQGRESDARRILTESLRVGIDDPQANLHYALLLRDAGEDHKARRYLRRVLDLDPENGVAQRALQGLQ